MQTTKNLGAHLLSGLIGVFSFGTRAEAPVRQYRQILEIRHQGGWGFRTAHASYRVEQALDVVAERNAEGLRDVGLLPHAITREEQTAA